MRCPLQLKYYGIVLHVFVLYGSVVNPSSNQTVNRRLHGHILPVMEPTEILPIIAILSVVTVEFGGHALLRFITTDPETLGELAAVSGVGPAKLESYGERVLAELGAQSAELS